MYYIVFKSAKAVKSDNIPQPQQEPDGKPWYISEGLSTAECMELTTRFADKLYGGGGKARGDGGGAAGAASRPAPSVAGAASTPMWGAGSRAPDRGGGPPRAAAPGRSDLLSDGPGEHTSVPRPLGSDVASGSKRPADGPPAHSGASPSPASFTPAAEDDVSGHPAKRARQEPAAPSCNNEATSSAAAHPSAPLAARPPAAAAPRGPAHGPSRFAAPPPAVVVQHAAQHAPPRAAPAPAAAAQPPAQHAVPPPAAADANSEKEEGELEDGELSLVDFADLGPPAHALVATHGHAASSVCNACSVQRESRRRTRGSPQATASPCRRRAPTQTPKTQNKHSFFLPCAPLCCTHFIPALASCLGFLPPSCSQTLPLSTCSFLLSALPLPACPPSSAPNPSHFPNLFSTQSFRLYLS